jgi:putative lipoprotein
MNRILSFSRIPVFLILIAALFILIQGCAPVFVKNDPWFGRDKLYHFVCTGAIGAGSTFAARSNGVCRSEAPVYGISAAVTIGAGKEWYDLKIKKTFWSWKDFTWDIIGGTAGSYAASR